MAVDPLDFVPRENLVALLREKVDENIRLREIFLRSDTPNVVEASKEVPELMFVSVSSHDPATLKAEFQARQRAYTTTPLDPEGKKLRMFAGGVTIWSGFPGSGKTTILRQLTCHLLHSGQGVFIASLEERPDDMLFRLIQTAAGDLDPADAFCEAFIGAYADKLRLWGMIGLASAQAIVGAIRVSARQGVRHAIIDSLTCLDVGASDWDNQRQFANELVALARTTNVHIHLVAHPKKPSQKDSLPDIADVAGSSDLGRLVDNVIFVQRSTDESPIFSDATPMKAVVRKQRHGTGMCGEIVGYFHRAHAQFSEGQFWNGPTYYLPESAYAVASGF